MDKNPQSFIVPGDFFVAFRCVAFRRRINRFVIFAKSRHLNTIKNSYAIFVSPTGNTRGQKPLKTLNISHGQYF